MTGGLWSVMTVVGPILLLVVLIWAWRSNRKAGAASVDRADAGAERLQRQTNAELDESEKS